MRSAIGTSYKDQAVSKADLPMRVNGSLLLFYQLRKSLAHFFNLWLYDELAIGCARVVRVIIFVVILGQIKGVEGNELCNDSRTIFERLVYLFNDFFRNRLLCLIVIKNYRAVLLPHISPLAIRRRGVMRAEEYSEQIVV